MRLIFIYQSNAVSVVNRWKFIQGTSTFDCNPVYSKEMLDEAVHVQ